MTTSLRRQPLFPHPSRSAHHPSPTLPNFLLLLSRSIAPKPQPRRRPTPLPQPRRRRPPLLQPRALSHRRTAAASTLSPSQAAQAAPRSATAVLYNHAHAAADEGGDFHASACLEDLRPGDLFEIQWRKNKDFPYDWWYSVVGHLEPCNANEHLCRCHEDDTIMLEFKHYAAGSRWRQTTVSRKDHREKGDETDGFYGGIRKLQTKDEISTWRRFWPVDVLS
ncbi:unnamed protein product [Triticum turgidum subsp. durum]|uniref:Uncharacterized protein n=1 Tax=Triticum turgidum subsp. durum TaxID=4567 RepID=A0A9R1SAI0_TRITD|nr:unnamed protein product [Triticum turgidum subsp. durum]